MAFGTGGKKRGFSDINVTPLVDVMLVLLVVFMVTAPLLSAGLHVELPNVAGSEANVKDAKLVVTVNREEKILLGEEDITDHVERALATNARIQREHELYIRADKLAHYGVVARVVSASRAAGVVGLNLLVEPPSAENAAEGPLPKPLPPGAETRP